ncbi:MAG: phosphodiester glycosidase family protein [Actinomycetota bacterium]
MRRFVLISIVTVAVLGVPSSSFAAPNGIDVPDGFKILERAKLADGLIHYRLQRSQPAAVVNVAWRAAGAPSELRVVLSNDAIAGFHPQAELTSAMCERLNCAVAVNGDFFAGEGQPVGAVLSDGRLMRSPNPKHHQFSIAEDGTMSTGSLAWRGTVVPTDLQPLELDGVNVVRDADELVLYTPSFGPTTGTNPYGVELVLEVVRPGGPMRVGQTIVVRLAEIRRAGDTSIPVDGAVLSGHGRSALALLALWERLRGGEVGEEALLRLDVDPDATNSVGGSPILVRDGRRWFAMEDRELYRLRHPRTMVGWTAAGDLLLVTVDGRQPGYSEGMTMVEAAELMIDLGADEAINMDGGGSTSFVVDGDIVNRPSDRAVRREGGSQIVSVPRSTDRVLGNAERPVAVALALVGPGSPSIPAPLLATGGLAIPLSGSNGGSSPRLVLGSDVARQDTAPIVLVLMTVSMGAVVVRRRAAAA